MSFFFLKALNLLQIKTCSFSYAPGEAESSGIIDLGLISNILSEIGTGVDYNPTTRTSSSGLKNFQKGFLTVKR